MKRFFFAASIFALLASAAFAQTASTNHQVTLNVNALAMVGLNSSSAVTLETHQPAEAGLAPLGATDSSKRLVYTAVNAAGLSRTITVQWDALNQAPAGTSLKVQVASISSLAGKAGTATAQRTISSVAQTIVTGIGSCVTGLDGGASLTYTLSVDSPELLQASESQTVTVAYTITDDV